MDGPKNLGRLPSQYPRPFTVCVFLSALPPGLKIVSGLVVIEASLATASKQKTLCGFFVLAAEEEAAVFGIPFALVVCHQENASYLPLPDVWTAPTPRME